MIDRTARRDVLGIPLDPGGERIITASRGGLVLMCRETGYGYEASASWGSHSDDGPDSRCAAQATSLFLWRALEDLEARMLACVSAVFGAISGGGDEADKALRAVVVNAIRAAITDAAATPRAEDEEAAP
jgi:hypothetical protein